MPYLHGKSIIKIAVADDHEMFREAIVIMIDRFENCKVVIQAANGRELLEKLEQKPNIDLVLLDIAMPEMDGFETASKIRCRFPEIKVLFCSMYNNGLAICRMIGSGGIGYIDKAASMSELKRTLFQVMKNDHNQHNDNGKIFFYNEGSGQIHNLSNYRFLETELKFLELICTEKPYKEIARELGLSERQVDYIREGLFSRFEVHSRIGLAFIANQGGIHSLQPA
jgi:DNA-binding NarL/FixJ family response regulator